MNLRMLNIFCFEILRVFSYNRIFFVRSLKMFRKRITSAFLAVALLLVFSACQEEQAYEYNSGRMDHLYINRKFLDVIRAAYGNP